MTFHYTDWFIRDPYIDLLQALYTWVGFHPLYQTTNQGEMNTAPLVLLMVQKSQTTTVWMSKTRRNQRDKPPTSNGLAGFLNHQQYLYHDFVLMPEFLGCLIQNYMDVSGFR